MKISKLVVVCVLVAFIFMCALSCVVGSKSRDSEINSLKEELAVAEKEAVDALLKHVECLEGRLAKGGVLPVAEEEDVVDVEEGNPFGLSEERRKLWIKFGLNPDGDGHSFRAEGGSESGSGK